MQLRNVSAPNFRRRVPVFGALLLVATGIGLGFALTGPKAALAGSPSSADLAVLKSMAWDLAARNGETAPSDAQVVGTTRVSAVQALMGEQIDSNQMVYAITMRGNFVGHMAHLAPGSQPPTGSVLTLIVDANTNGLLDWSITDGPSDLSTLGTPTALS